MAKFTTNYRLVFCIGVLLCLHQIICALNVNNKAKLKNDFSLNKTKSTKESKNVNQTKLKKDTNVNQTTLKKKSNINQTKLKKNSNVNQTKPKKNLNVKQTKPKKVISEAEEKQFRAENYDYLGDLGGRTGLYRHVTDYVVKEIIDAEGKLKSENAVYIDILLGTRYLEDNKRVKKDDELCKKMLKGKKIFMPISYKKCHAVVLYADPAIKEVQYYDPIDPILSDRYSSGEKRFKRFIQRLKERNKYVKDDEKIDTKYWKLIKPKIVPPKQIDGYSCALMCIRWIDLVLYNGIPTIGNKDTEISVYQESLKKAVERRMKKLDPKLVAQRKESHSYGTEY